MKSFLAVIINIVSLVFTKHHHHHHSSHHQAQLADILNSKENFYSKTNIYIQNTMNQIFDDLNLPKQFIESPRIKLFLTMHYNLNNIAETNFEIYDVLRNTTSVIVDNKAVNKIRLDETVREILSEIQFYDHKEINYMKNKSNVQITKQEPRTTKKPFTGFNDSEEFNDFIRRFLGKVKRLTVDDLFKKNSSSKSVDSSRRNLELWDPLEHIEADGPVNDTGTRRIYRGKKTNIRNFPFVASVHLLTDFLCAGSVIARDLVITSASCVQIHYNNRFFRENPKTTYVRIGSQWTSRLGELVPVMEVYFYPTYNPKTLKHNIALLRLGRTIKYSTHRRTKVRRIQLDQGDGSLPANTREIVILGWGAKKPNQLVNMFEKLTVAYLDIFPLDICRQIYSKEYVTETNFCAGFMSKGGGACNRDVGAPGIVGGVLVGVVSFGAPVCGAMDSPTVYTRVGPYFNWIQEIIRNHPPRYGRAKTTKMTSKALVYYFNTMTTRTYPHITPFGLKRITPALRAQDAPEAPEEEVLQEVLTDIAHQNNTMIHDIIDQDLNGDFHEILNLTTTKDYIDIPANSLDNKTIYLNSGINNEPGFVDTTTQSPEPTYVLGTTSADEPMTDSVLQTESITGAPMYGEYEHNNYESAPKDNKAPVYEYASGDSQESRQEYLDQLKAIKKNDAASEDDYEVAQPAGGPKIGGDGSGDVAYET